MKITAILLSITATLCGVELDPNRFMADSISYRSDNRNEVYFIAIPSTIIGKMINKSTVTNADVLNKFDNKVLLMASLARKEGNKYRLFSKEECENLDLLYYDNIWTHHIIKPAVITPDMQPIVNDLKKYIPAPLTWLCLYEMKSEDYEIRFDQDGCILLQEGMSILGNINARNRSYFNETTDKMGRLLLPSWKFNPYTGEKIRD